MDGLLSSWVCVTLLLALMIGSSSGIVHSQIQPPTPSFSNVNPNIDKTVVSVNSSLTIQVSNKTLDMNQKTLRSAIINFLSSGPGVLKSSEKEQVLVKSKIVNQINKDTQNVEGTEATNAIIGIELGKALSTLVSSQAQNISKIITVQTGSICRPSATESISCENTVVVT